jgi:pseudaminic acid biosynthesis-associated methylase
VHLRPYYRERMSSQLDTWRGEFGRAYTERNETDPAVRVPAFARMLDGLEIGSALEIGCNAGHNLVTLARVLGPEARVAGVEPSPYPRGIAERAGLAVVEGSSTSVPSADGEFDLVLTCGVLIHVPPAAFEPSLRELHRVSRRYLLAIEYFAVEETAVRYRGQDDLLWKRDFGGAYRALFHALELLRSGYWDRQDGFDRCHWWLLEKPRAS